MLGSSAIFVMRPLIRVFEHFSLALPAMRQKISVATNSISVATTEIPGGKLLQSKDDATQTAKCQQFILSRITLTYHKNTTTDSYRG